MGYFIVNCDDNGVRNHIIHEAQWDMGDISIFDSILCIVKNHMIIVPIIIIISGIIFIYIGINVGYVEILVHEIDLPDMVAINDRRIIGLMIGDFSFKLMEGVHKCGDHSVAILNRIE